MSAPQMTTAEALRSALASTIACSAQELQEAVGQVVVATAAELPASAPAGADARSVFDPQARTTVLLADRIPAGQEAQALAEEIERHHGRQAAQAVLGDRVAELLGGDGKVSKYIESSSMTNDLGSSAHRYALASHDPDGVVRWSVGGEWSASLLDHSPTLMTGPEVDAFKVRHPNARIVDVIVYREACEVYSAGCNSVLDHSERSTPQTRQAAREAGIKALIRAGFPEDALNIVGPEHTEQAPAAMKLSKCKEPSPSRAYGHTAYEVTVEDVEVVLSSNALAVANTDGKSFEAMAEELHGDLDFYLIEEAALAGDDLDEQTGYANDEIARQLREMGVLEPLKQACDSPSPGM